MTIGILLDKLARFLEDFLKIVFDLKGKQFCNLNSALSRQKEALSRSVKVIFHSACSEIGSADKEINECVFFLDAFKYFYYIPQKRLLGHMESSLVNRAVFLEKQQSCDSINVLFLKRRINSVIPRLAFITDDLIVLTVLNGIKVRYSIYHIVGAPTVLFAKLFCNPYDVLFFGTRVIYRQTEDLIFDFLFHHTFSSIDFKNL